MLLYGGFPEVPVAPYEPKWLFQLKFASKTTSLITWDAGVPRQTAGDKSELVYMGTFPWMLPPRTCCPHSQPVIIIFQRWISASFYTVPLCKIKWHFVSLHWPITCCRKWDPGKMCVCRLADYRKALSKAPKMFDARERGRCQEQAAKEGGCRQSAIYWSEKSRKAN